MSNWLPMWLRRRPVEAGLPAGDPPAEEPPRDIPEIGALRDAIAQGDGALERFQEISGGRHARAALDVVLGARAEAPEALVLAAAELLVARGAARDAVQLLEGRSGVGALALGAQLAAAEGNLGLATELLEAALAIDVGIPGGLERVARWRGDVGGAPPSIRPTADATLITAAAPKTQLRVVAEVGRGGSATVFEAEDPWLGRRVALKAYHHPSADVGREVEVAVALRGTGVVRIFDACREEGWIVLEWADGGSLRDAAARGTTPPFDRWLPSIVVALARAHRAGWVHGDVKPANILFRADGAAVLADFGLASRVGAPRDAGTGTPGFISPKRATSGIAGPADDLFALGCVIELAAGGDAAGLALARACKGPSSTQPTAEQLGAALAVSVRDPSGARDGHR